MTQRRASPSAIEDELDLHGYTAPEARVVVCDFLRMSAQRGCSRVRIIVGKGTRSAYGAVLPDVVKAYLNELGYTYTTAPLFEGGAGALDVCVTGHV